MPRTTTMMALATPLARRAAAAMSVALACALMTATALGAPSGPAPLKSSEVVESLRLAGMDDDAIRRALAAYPPYLERAMAAQRERIEPLKSMKLAGSDATPADQLKSAQEAARSVRSAGDAVDAAERQLVDAIVATIPESDAEARQRIGPALEFRQARRSTAAWARDRLVSTRQGASAADPREALSRIALADDVRARALDRIGQYERAAVPVLRQWRESCADVLVARARAAELDPISRRIAAAAPTASRSMQLGTQLRSMLSDMRTILPPAEYEQFRTSVLRTAYPSILSSASRADRAMLSALRKAAKGEPDAEAAARNQQRYRDWAAARDARCNSLMEAIDRGMPASPMLAAMAGPMQQQLAERDAAAASDLAKVMEDMKALRALAEGSVGQLEGLDPSDAMPDWVAQLPEGMGMPAGESSVSITMDPGATEPDLGAAGGAVAQGEANAPGNSDAGGAGNSPGITTSTTISSVVAFSTSGPADGGPDISGPVQVMTITTVDGASTLGEGFEITLGDSLGDDGMMSIEYSGGDEIFLPNHDQGVDETRISRSMGSPRADAIALPSLLETLGQLGMSELSQIAQVAVRDSADAYAAAHARLVRALAIEWSGRDPDAPPEAEPANPQEQIQKAMEFGAEEMRRASDAGFIERRFGAWQRAPAAYAQLESALIDGVAQAISIGASEAGAAARQGAVESLRARRALAVEQDLMRASGRPSSLDMGGYAASLDLRSIVASTPLASADKASAAGALAGYEQALAALLSQRREAAVEIERSNQLTAAVAMRQFSAMTGDGAAEGNVDAVSAEMERARARTDAAMARGQSVGRLLEEWQTAQAEALCAALTPAGRSRVGAALTRARHPTVARDSTSADPQIARALSMVESNDAVLQAVISVAGEYQSAYDAIFARLVEADAARQAAVADMAAANAKSPPDETAISAARTRRSAATREITRLRTERSELNARTLRALRAALGPQLGQDIADLPPRRPMPRVSAAAAAAGAVGAVTPG